MSSVLCFNEKRFSSHPCVQCSTVHLRLRCLSNHCLTFLGMLRFSVTRELKGVMSRGNLLSPHFLSKYIASRLICRSERESGTSCENGQCAKHAILSHHGFEGDSEHVCLWSLCNLISVIWDSFHRSQHVFYGTAKAADVQGLDASLMQLV